MRILYLTPGCFDKGGISRYSRYQIEALREIIGVRNVRALSLLGPDADRLEVPFQVQWHGPCGVGAGTLSRLSFARRAIFNALSWRPNIIWSAHVNFGPLLNAASDLCSARTVLNVYGLEIWSGLSANRKAHLARASQIMADCYFTARYVQEQHLHPRESAVIWDPVDLARFHPGPVDPALVAKYALPDPANHFVVMSLGRLAKAAAHKGYDRLIEVISRLAPDHPSLRLVIAGRGDDRPRLEALAVQQRIADRVRFTGSIDEPDLPGVYRCAHVFSLVSDRGHGRGEGIPLTPLEAMACGVPIIVGDEDGSLEAVFEGRNGFVVSPRDPAHHERALNLMISDPTLRTYIGGEARAVAETHFSYRRFVAEHRALLATVAN